MLSKYSLTLWILLLTGCATTGSTNPPTACSVSSYDPAFMSPQANAAIDQDEMELNLIP